MAKKRQTKAGMLENDRRDEVKKTETETEKDAESSPKISKEKAEKRDSGKPLH